MLSSQSYNKSHQYVAFGHRTAFSRRCAWRYTYKIEEKEAF